MRTAYLRNECDFVRPGCYFEGSDNLYDDKWLKLLFARESDEAVLSSSSTSFLLDLRLLRFSLKYP